MKLNRRDFGKLALAAATPARSLFAAPPNSKFDGVQIGVITYSYRDRPELANDAVALLKLLIESNISAIELMPPVAENFAGAPAGPARGGGGRGAGRGPGGPPTPAGMVVAADGSVSCPVVPERPPAGRAGAGGGGRGFGGPPSPEQEAYAADLKKWRLSASMDKFKALRKMYNDAGVSIYCHKLTPTANMSDEEYEYMFNVAGALGANQVSLELAPNDMKFMKRLGDFALKHNMVAAYHYHTLATLTAWDEALAVSKGNAVNLDCGHYLAGTGLSPIPALEKYGKQGRIGSLHLKDRTTPAHCALNLAWGKGDTPIAEILRTMRKNKWTFPASIELEYQIPEGSTAVAEVRKCVEFCKKALA